MESLDTEEYKKRVSELERENLQLQKELAVKSVISEISQMEAEQGNSNSIYERIFILLSEIMDVDNFYIVLEENKLIRIPYMTDQNDSIEPEQLNEQTNPELRNSLTAYALTKSSAVVLSQAEIDDLCKQGLVKVIGSIPKQWLFLPFHGDNITGGIVVQSYAKEDSYSYNDMSILAYVTMHIGHFLSAHIARTQIQDQLKKLKAAQNQLVHSEKMASVGQLAAGVAHEINNPLGYVNSNLNSLREYIADFKAYAKDIDNLPNEASNENESLTVSDVTKKIQQLNEKHDVEFILSDTGEIINECLFGMEKVKNIIQSLKNFSHAGEDKRELTDINACIKEATVIVWNELKYHCELDTRYGEIPLTYCYPNQLNQIFMNLLINASHAIKEKGIITIETKCEKGMIYISIADNGCGIDEEHLSQLFNPFFTTKPVGQGTGLGLSISYGIMENHGGKIEVESTLGEGTCFTIHLPVVEDDSDQVIAVNGSEDFLEVDSSEQSKDDNAHASGQELQ
jgi:signal transduction histidine kinase